MIRIRSMQANDIARVVYLHHSSLSQTFSSKMGVLYLRSLYRLLVEEGQLHRSFVAEERDSIVGAIIATKDFAKTQTSIAKKLFWLSPPLMFWAMITRKLTIQELINYMWFEMRLRSHFPKSRATILALFVEKRLRRRGVGKNLVKTLMGELTHQGHDNIYVDTLMSNGPAQRFYQALGFTIEENVFDSVMLARRL